MPRFINVQALLMCLGGLAVFIGAPYHAHAGVEGVCKGGNPLVTARCHYSHTGNGCSDCALAHFQFFGACKECASIGGGSWPKFVNVCLVLVVVAVWGVAQYLAEKLESLDLFLSFAQATD